MSSCLSNSQRQSVDMLSGSRLRRVPTEGGTIGPHSDPIPRTAFGADSHRGT
jgi:hypothetical protein